MKQVPQTTNSTLVKMFLCGDVMTGRGIDQILPYPSKPQIYESYVKDASEYVKLAETVNGKIPKPADFSYIWGDAIKELEQNAPDARTINLETSITKSEDYWEPKGINYRMNPKNIGCLTAPKIDCCAVANNHTLDWGYAGLTETLQTLEQSGIKHAGAGENLRVAAAPAIIKIPKKARTLVFSYGSLDSGVPPAWAASESQAGINLIEDYDEKTAQRVIDNARLTKKTRDITITSIHWGDNWGYRIPAEHKEFAHKLIDSGQIDVIHGHSSHHAKGIEVYKDKLILYGCGDFLNDYEGIGGYEQFRGDLSLMYFPSIDSLTGRLRSLTMVPTMTRRFRLNKANKKDGEWLMNMLKQEGRKLGTAAEMEEDGNLHLKWQQTATRDVSQTRR